jgi:predicted RNA-binding Zn-ribbon protein involved in translation (DUF1610 family)
MPTFRCTSCDRRVDSPVVIGAGDCPHCGGDVVYDIHAGGARDASRDGVEDAREGGRREPLLRRLFRR